MPILVNLRHLELKDIALRGELPIGELDLGSVDELIQLPSPLMYDLVVQQQEKSVLVQGRLQLRLRCECAKCLKPFDHDLDLSGWACLLELEGEERVPVDNDRVDLTTFVREDILLAFPQYPMCEPGCGGLPVPLQSVEHQEKDPDKHKGALSIWAELNKLKL